MNKATVTATPGTQTIDIERVFEAPREKVFAAMTTKDKIAKWWTGPGYSVKVEELDARSGGHWKFTHSDDKGNSFGFHGSYHLVSPEMIIQTFEFDGLGEPGHVALEKATLEDLGDGRTKLQVHATYMSVEDRDGMIASGMEGGLQQTYNALDAVLADM